MATAEAWSKVKGMSREVTGKLKHRAQSRLQGCQYRALILRWNLNTDDILGRET